MIEGAYDLPDQRLATPDSCVPLHFWETALATEASLWPAKHEGATNRTPIVLTPELSRGYHRRIASRHLTLVFRRNPDHDGQQERIRYEGYHICWPDGRPVSLGFQRFCQQGSRLLGLGRRMQGKAEQLIEVGYHPVEGLEAPLTRPGPGIRCRRFFLERGDRRGKVFFFNGSPTEMEFDVDQDDRRVVDWLGLQQLQEGERSWFDLSARTL